MPEVAVLLQFLLLPSQELRGSSFNMEEEEVIIIMDYRGGPWKEQPAKRRQFAYLICTLLLHKVRCTGSYL